MTFLNRSFLVVMMALVPAGSLSAKTYYVRMTGNDADNGTSPSHAWRTIKQAASNVVEGDVAYVGAGTYQEASSTVFNAVGKKDNPVSFIADRDGSQTGDSGDVIVLTPSTGSSVYLWDFQASHHFFITGFTFRRAPNAAASNPYLFGLRLIPTTTKKNTEAGTFVFTSCRFENLYYDVFSSEAADVSFTDCVSSGNKYISLALYNTDATISNCTFVNGQFMSVYSYGSTSTCEVANSTFTNTLNYGIYAWNTPSLLATNNVFTNVRYSLSAYADASTIDGCTFSLTDAFSRSNWDNWAVQIGSPTNGAASCSNCTTTGYNVGAYILSNDVVVTNLSVTGLSDGYYNADWTPNTNWKDCYGIVVHGYPNADGTWSYCRRFAYNGSSGTFSNCYIGIYTYSSDITISSATISGCMYGVYSSGAYEPGSVVTVSNSTIKDCLWNGIAVNQGASLSATNSKFLNNGVNKADGGWGWGWGLYVYGYKAASANYWDGVPGNASLTVQNCQFTGNGHGFCAVSFKKELLALSGNTVDGGLVMNGVTPVSHYGWGAWLSNGDYALQNNEFSVKNCYIALGTQYGKFSTTNYTIRDNYYGILVQNNSNAAIANCTVTANPGVGVYSTDGTSVIITNSDLSGNGYGFIDYQSKAVSVKNSTANNNLYYGVFAQSADAFAVERCKVLNNGNWGLVSYLTKSAAIKNNVVAGNKYGAYLADSGTGTEVWNNTISNNTTNYGLYAASGTVKVYNNIISGNGAYGLGSDQATLIHSHNLVSGHSPGTDFWKNGLTSTQAAALRTADEPSKPPRFLDAAVGDYRLAKGSPAINAGMNAPGIVDNDMLGNSRPTYGVTEIGAYEYIDKSGSIRPLTWNEQK